MLYSYTDLTSDMNWCFFFLCYGHLLISCLNLVNYFYLCFLYICIYPLCMQQHMSLYLLHNVLHSWNPTLTWDEALLSNPLSIATFPLPWFTISFHFKKGWNYSWQSPSIQELSSFSTRIVPYARIWRAVSFRAADWTDRLKRGQRCYYIMCMTHIL